VEYNPLVLFELVQVEQIELSWLGKVLIFMSQEMGRLKSSTTGEKYSELTCIRKIKFREFDKINFEFKLVISRNFSLLDSISKTTILCH